jgi:hypothetical protein
MASRNTHFADLGYTFYPVLIDSRNGIDPETGLQDLTKFSVNEDLALNVNYEDRGSNPTANDYYVLAQDVNVLQDAVLSVERILGQMPHVRTDVGTNDTTSVSERIAKLESSTKYDARFGGAGWISGTSPTILSHTHTGGANDCQKINLNTMTTGTISRLRLQLDAGVADPLTSEYIPYNSSGNTSIKTVIDNKLDKLSGGVMQGDFTIQGNVTCRMFGEIDVVSLTGSGINANLAQNVSDNAAYCGQAKYFPKAAGIPSTAVFSCSFPVRYNEYSVIVRAKTDYIGSPAAVARIDIYGSGLAAGDTELMSQFIQSNEFTAENEYQTFYFTVNHKRLNTSAVDKNLYVKIRYQGNGIANVWFDSITVMPIHTAIWDD